LSCSRGTSRFDHVVPLQQDLQVGHRDGGELGLGQWQLQSLDQGRDQFPDRQTAQFAGGEGNA
jgi:hypothetical protein